MSAASLIARGRAAAESLMTDACTIRRRTGEATDPNSGVITPTYGDPLYSGKCRVQQRTNAGQGQDVGEAFVLVTRFEVQLPMSATGLVEGDQITITASALDPDLVDRVFTVRDVAAKSHLTARRVGVTEVLS
ncbi:DUF6093 family protein [Micromonospora sp. DT47]|uniref:DUF6093 family protein n=1 Tax=Micromonospora sp. DT47 TaxID=3393431 RepID=UPI003CE78812